MTTLSLPSSWSFPLPHYLPHTLSIHSNKETPLHWQEEIPLLLRVAWITPIMRLAEQMEAQALWPKDFGNAFYFLWTQKLTDFTARSALKRSPHSAISLCQVSDVVSVLMMSHRDSVHLHVQSEVTGSGSDCKGLKSCYDKLLLLFTIRIFLWDFEIF